jgi:hypothetical protein
LTLTPKHERQRGRETEKWRRRRRRRNLLMVAGIQKMMKKRG